MMIHDFPTVAAHDGMDCTLSHHPRKTGPVGTCSVVAQEAEDLTAVEVQRDLLDLNKTLWAQGSP